MKKLPKPRSSLDSQTEVLFETVNNMGFSVSKPDLCMQDFVYFCKQTQQPVLDLGAAYGTATHAALKQGGHVIAVDLDAHHLQVLKERAPKEHLHKLETVQDSILNLTYENESIGAILASRVLHFLKPEDFESIVQRLYNWLSVEGEIFVSVATPFSKFYTEFIPVFEKRREEGHKWPGRLDNLSELSSPYLKNMPDFMHLFDLDILKDMSARIVSQELNINPRA